MGDRPEIDEEYAMGLFLGALSRAAAALERIAVVLERLERLDAEIGGFATPSPPERETNT